MAEPPKGEAPGLCLGRHTASTLGRAWQLCRGTSPFPQGDSSPPATSRMTCLVGRVLAPHAMGHREELGPGRRPQAQGRQRRRGPGSSPSRGEPHTFTRFPITKRPASFRYSDWPRTGRAPVPQKGAYKRGPHLPQTRIPPPNGTPLLKLCSQQTGLRLPAETKDPPQKSRIMSPLAPGAPDMKPAAPQVKVLQDRSTSPLQCGLPNSRCAKSPLPDLSPQTDAS